jgi:hypothetical protein
MNADATDLRKIVGIGIEAVMSSLNSKGGGRVVAPISNILKLWMFQSESCTVQYVRGCKSSNFWWKGDLILFPLGSYSLPLYSHGGMRPSVADHNQKESKSLLDSKHKKHFGM